MAADHPPSTSPTLLRMLALPGSDEAWRTFVDRYGPLIEAHCRRAGLQQADVDDVRAEVCGKLVEAMEGFQYDPARRFRGYLRRIVDNVIRSHWRVIRRRPGWVGRGGDGDDEMPEPLASLGDELDLRIQSRLDDVARLVERVRFEVGPTNWRAFEMIAVERVAGAEVARQLGKSVAAVYVAKLRVRDRLLAAVGAEPPERSDHRTSGHES